MFQELKFQLSTAILTILTLAAGVGAFLSLENQLRTHIPDDGIIWADRNGHVEADYVDPRGSGKDSVHVGDWITGIEPITNVANNPIPVAGIEIDRAVDVAQALAGIGDYRPAQYHLVRGGVDFSVKVLVGEMPRDKAVFYEFAVGAAYLLIGLFVYFRRGSAQKAQHFYIFCLVSFIFFCSHYTGTLNGLDTGLYYANVGAGLAAAAIFLHFCVTFPDPLPVFRGFRQVVWLYVPGALLFAAYVAVSSQAVLVDIPPVDLRWILDRLWLLLTIAPCLAGAIALSLEYHKAEDPVTRQQLKWLRNGTFCAIVPFLLLYVLPYAAGSIPNEYLKLSVFSLGAIPLTLAYAILRYRLMDVDILFGRAYAYTLATLLVLAAFYGTILSLGSLVKQNFKDLGQPGLLVVMLTAAFLFQPIRNWIQERLDRYFYRERYDYRRTLIEFARELSSETDLDKMQAAVGERLLQTIQIKHLAFFLAEERDGRTEFRLKKTMGENPRMIGTSASELDLSFLNRAHDEQYLFFQRTRHQIDAVSLSWPAPMRRTIADLDLTYYLPCTARGRKVAYLGVSRTLDGDYLSSVDLDLLLMMAGYIGIAIENAGLYRSLQRKVVEYEKLKEFSENIVESINVGILAADLDDRVESWNTRLEELSGISRERAVGQRLSDLFPADLGGQFDRVRGETGIHHIYKFVWKLSAAAAAANGNGHGRGNGNGQRRPPSKEVTMNIAIAPLVAKDQEQIGRLIIFDDVTDRAELEQRLVQADKLSSIGLLAAGVAHEVNTPLAVISTYAQMLGKQVSGDSQKSMILDKIAKQTFRASEIVNSLLNFSRTSTTTFGAVSINKVVQETLSLLEHQLQKAGVMVKTELDPAAPMVHGNAGKLQQVFLNLFLNARDAMPSGGSLDVRTWTENGRMRAEVADSGTGIASDLVHRIYDPFFTTKGAKKGTGLGLSVTYGIIQEHSGLIEVSNRPGGGARFRLELPLSAPVARPLNVA